MFKTIYAALAAVLLAAPMASAQVQAPACQKECCETVCCDTSCCSGAWFVDAEVTFMRYHEATGVTRGSPADVQGEFDFDAAPRVTVGYVNCDGLGARIRWWDYEADANLVDAGGPFTRSVEATTIDFELFQEVCLGCGTTAELSGGIRWHEFEQVFPLTGTTPLANLFDGIGGVAAVQVNRAIGNCWSVYGRGRIGILMDDQEQDVGNNGTIFFVQTDTTVPITELALGVEYTNCNWSLHAGMEWQNYANIVLGSDAAELSTDAGYGGFVFGGSVIY